MNPILTPAGINTCNPDTVYFASQILPLLVSTCAMSGCHDEKSRKDGVVMTDYVNSMKTVKAGDPKNSELYKSLIDKDPEDRMPMAPIPPFNQTQIELVSKWITQGAKNNACTNTIASNCVISNMSFSKDVLPIFISNCNGCHLQTYISNGSLMNSILQNGKAAPMPKNAYKLNSCSIATIQAWINKGALNN